MPLFTLFIISLFILNINGQCLQEVISNTQYKCGKTTRFDSSSSSFPSKFLSGTSELSISGILTINDMCSATYPFNFFTIKISPENQGEVAVFRHQISTTDQFDVYAQDWTGDALLYPYTWTTSETLGQNTSMEFYISLNLVNGYIRAQFGLSTQWWNYGTYVRNFTGWKFDKTTRFEFCTDSSGKNVASCTVNSLATEYQYTGTVTVLRLGFQIFGGVDPVLVGSYTFDQTVKDSTNSLGSAKLGTATSLIPNGKAPKYIVEGGVEFTDPNQYILIPTFTPAKPSPTLNFLFTIGFWLKIENITDNNGYIFRYARSNLTENIWSISLTNNQQLQLQCGANTYTYYNLIPYSTWNLFTVDYLCLNWATTCYISGYMNSTLIFRYGFYLTDDFSTLFQSSDLVLLGGPNGFKGKIVNFKIFNPGSQRRVTPTCESPSECSLNLGFVEPTNKNCLICTNATKFYQGCRVCPSGYYLSGEDCVEEVQEEVKAFPGAAASKGTAAAAKATTQAVSAVSSGSSSGATAAISGKVFSNIKYINISYSSELANALETWTPNYISMGFNDNMPDNIETRFVNSTVPYVFAKHQVNSCFLINFWEPLIMLVLLILVLVIVLFLDWAISYWKKDRKSLQYRIITRIKVMILNFLIVQLYGLYGDVVFFALIEFQNQRLTPGLNLLSVFAIVILSGAMLFGFFLHLNLLKRYQNVKRSFGGNAETKQHFDNWIKDHEGIQVIYGDFKDYSLIHQSFLLIMTIRDILLSLILSTLFDHPLVECILILMMNIAMLVYLFIKVPFREKIAQIQQVVLELITMVVNINILILAVFDAKNSEAFDQRKTIGKLLILINMVFNFTVVGFMLVNLFVQGWEIYKDYKSRRHEKRLRVKAPRNILSLQQNNDEFETRKSPSKALENNDLKVTDFLRARENPSETCQTMIKTQFDETIILNNLQRNTLNDSMDMTINSTKNAGGGGIDNSIVSPHPSQFSVMGLIRPHDGKRHKIRKIRKGDQFN